MEKILVNQIYGRWKVLKKSNRKCKNGLYYWTCECQCTKKTIKEVDQYSLLSGRSKSCGCLRQENKLNKLKNEMIGHKYNKLTVIDYYGIINNKNYWTCQCDCGNSKVVSTTDLKNGGIKSCGCTKKLTEEHKEKLRKIRKKYNEFIFYEDYVIGKTIKGEEFIFDFDDYEKIININKYWKINNKGYVLCYIDGNEFQMHRYIMNLDKYNIEDNIIVDHIDGNRVNNRKHNLRVCVKSDNPKNCRLYVNNTSGHKGISWNKRLEKWQVYLQVDKKMLYLGIYSNLEEAISVRKKAEIKHFGEFSRDYKDEVLHND